MPAITIRHLSDSTHAALKQRAAAEKLSVEALVRRLLAASNNAERQDAAAMAGFSEAAAWIAPPVKSPQPDLWGAMQGTVHIPPGTDLTAPIDEAWEAVT